MLSQIFWIIVILSVRQEISSMQVPQHTWGNHPCDSIAVTKPPKGVTVIFCYQCKYQNFKVFVGHTHNLIITRNDRVKIILLDTWKLLRFGPNKQTNPYMRHVKRVMASVNISGRTRSLDGWERPYNVHFRLWKRAAWMHHSERIKKRFTESPLDNQLLDNEAQLAEIKVVCKVQIIYID